MIARRVLTRLRRPEGNALLREGAGKPVLPLIPAAILSFAAVFALSLDFWPCQSCALVYSGGLILALVQAERSEAFGLGRPLWPHRRMITGFLLKSRLRLKPAPLYVPWRRRGAAATINLKGVGNDPDRS